MFDHLVRACRVFPPGAGEPSRADPQELQIVRSDLDDKSHGNAVLRCVVDGLGSMNDWQACGSDWPPWHVSEPLQCRAVTQASKVHSLSSMLSISLLVHLFRNLLLLCEQHLEVVGRELHLLSWRL